MRGGSFEQVLVMLEAIPSDYFKKGDSIRASRTENGLVKEGLLAFGLKTLILLLKDLNKVEFIFLK